MPTSPWPFLCGIAFALCGMPPGTPTSESQEGDLGSAVRSLAIPGWGQHHQSRWHWWAFPVIEAGSIAGYLDGRHSGSRYRTQYRDLAWNEARVPVWSGVRREGPWEYYERMSRWVASGRFDQAPDQADVHPETDPETYNGSIWELARALHIPSELANDLTNEELQETEAWARAMAYYRERAVPEELEWDWSRAAPDAQAHFRELIRSSDHAFRRATGFVGLLLLNHFVSATDAWLFGSSGPLQHLPFRMDGTVLPTPDGGGGWIFSMRIFPQHRGTYP